MQNNTQYQTDVLERFIPISLDRLISDLLTSDLLPLEQHLEFKQFCSTYTSLFHAQSHAYLQDLKQLYLPFNPDRDTLINPQENSGKKLAYLKDKLYAILEDANYERISEDDLNEALNKISPYGVQVSVDFDDFAEVALFYRGSAIQQKLYRNWKKLSFKKQPIDILIYKRLFVFLQPKNRQQWVEYFINNKKISAQKAEKEADKALKKFAINNDNDVVYLKLFKDIPRADLEMQFPNTRIKMRLFDKIKLAVTGGGGTAGGVMATIGKLSATIDPVSALIAIGGLLGLLWRQISKIFSQRAKYSATLTKNLYFYSLDNNMGALTYLVDTAEAEECKEAILAYFFLLIKGETNRASLDQCIENYIYEKYEIPMDFEIDDGLDKLQKSSLLSRFDQLIKTIPLAEANSRLRQQWDQIIDSKEIV